MEYRILVATRDDIWAVEATTGAMARGDHPEHARPTCLAADPWDGRRAWCGTDGNGVLRTDDLGASWHPVGLADAEVSALATSPVQPDLVWAGTEPSAVWRSEDGGFRWEKATGLLDLPSSSEWSFPPRPETHHVRWIAPHPHNAARLWVAIEAGALVTTPDGGVTWQDRVASGPYDTHELAVHPERPDTLRVAAGDGYFESADGGASWASPERGLEVGYLRSVAIDPGDLDVVLVSAASGARSAYAAGRSDGRLYRRVRNGDWERILDGWPEPPDTIAPLLVSGAESGQLWAADERGVHLSNDGGRSWRQAAVFPKTPPWLRGIAIISAD